MRRGQPKVAIYTRVSTTGQDPAMQLSELRKYCRNRSWIVEHEYTDKGISGSKDSRPELDRLISDAHKRRFDVVVVWKFDPVCEKRLSLASLSRVVRIARN